MLYVLELGNKMNGKVFSNKLHLMQQQQHQHHEEDKYVQSWNDTLGNRPFNTIGLARE